jgi:hypothetical protein
MANKDDEGESLYLTDEAIEELTVHGLKEYLPLEIYVILYPTDTTHPTLMPDREDLSLRENCNMKKGKTDRNMTCKFRSSAIHSFGTISTHRSALLSDQGQSSWAGYCYLFTNHRA